MLLFFFFWTVATDNCLFLIVILLYWSVHVSQTRTTAEHTCNFEPLRVRLRCDTGIGLVSLGPARRSKVRFNVQTPETVTGQRRQCVVPARIPADDGALRSSRRRGKHHAREAGHKVIDYYRSDNDLSHVTK